MEDVLEVEMMTMETRVAVTQHMTCPVSIAWNPLPGWRRKVLDKPHQTGDEEPPPLPDTPSLEILVPCPDSVTLTGLQLLTLIHIRRRELAILWNI